MNVKDGNSDIYSFCAEYHLCTFPGCEDRRVRRNGEDLQFCNHHRCEHDSCRNGKDRGAFCRAHTCGDTHCISFVRGGGDGDPERFCERHRRCLKPQCGRFCHVRENGLPSPFCGAHFCEFADCGNERDSAAHCGEHTCVEPGCAKGRESPKGLYCKEHGCRTKGCTLRRFGREHYYYDGFPGLDNNVRCPHDAERHGRYCECPHCEREAARARTFEYNRGPNEFENLDTVYIRDMQAYIKVKCGWNEVFSWYGEWSEVTKATNCLFGREIFNDQPNWLEAGCLFTNLCVHRANLEKERGKCFRDKCAAEGSCSLVKTGDYLTYARRCFNTGLSYPLGVRIPGGENLGDLDVCISHAERIRAEAQELYEKQDSMRGLHEAEMEEREKGKNEDKDGDKDEHGDVEPPLKVVRAQLIASLLMHGYLRK
ncbi:hypothetical protein QQX98_003492 [Neonectria punicea]|uniref:Uncharacterized protein n=1 Tax=Neonectria punicea TaxID=979145 RepID=A0ABR1HDB5_9HYPO